MPCELWVFLLTLLACWCHRVTSAHFLSQEGQRIGSILSAGWVRIHDGCKLAACFLCRWAGVKLSGLWWEARKLDCFIWFEISPFLKNKTSQVLLHPWSIFRYLTVHRADALCGCKLLFRYSKFKADQKGINMCHRMCTFSISSCHQCSTKQIRQKNK